MSDSWLARLAGRLRSRSNATVPIAAPVEPAARAAAEPSSPRASGATALTGSLSHADAGTWDELRDLLAAALERPAAERAAFAELACAGRPALRRQLDELLEAHQRDGLLDHTAGALLTRAAPSGDWVGRTVGRYEILDRLGAGGMGVVYRARDPELGRIVALKFLPPHLSANPEAQERLRVEAQAAAALEHPNICTVHEIGQSPDGQLFIAMPFYEGETLKDRLARGPLPVAQAAELALQAARGLAKAHERGILHRDIKPANLIVTRDGVLKILDFGIAKLTGESLTAPGGLVGTLGYMSPEQVLGGELDGRTDVWALGVVLYEMLVGERPFGGFSEAAVLHDLVSREPVPPRARRPSLPEAVDGVVLGALAKQPEQRICAAELAVELERMLRALEAEGAGAAETGRDAGSLGGVLPDGERRHATMLAVTVVEYGRLVDTLAPGELERTLTGLRALADEVAQRHGGLVNESVGDTTIVLFGVPAAHEDDSVRAVRAALEMHRRIRELGVTSEGNPLVRIRAGVHSGTVAMQPPGDGSRAYRIGGDAPTLAVRLSAHAGPDEVWTTPDCQRAVTRFFETEALPPLALVPGGAPVVPHRVRGASAHRSRLDSAERADLTAFTAREAEMATLARCLADVAGGEGRFVTIAGDAGLGKSRLLREFRRELCLQDLLLLQGHCESYGGGTAYLPFMEVLRGFFAPPPGGPGELSSEHVVDTLRRFGPELEEFIPFYLHLLALPSADSPLPRHLIREHFRLALQEAVAALITVAARSRPTALLLEDWQWADDASQAALRQIVELVAGFPLLVLVTYRPGQPLDWGTPSHHATVQLQPLDVSASAGMLRSILRARTLPEPLAGLIHERTGGNPFFVEEITQTLVEEGALRVEGEEAILAGRPDMLRLPDTVQAVIRARLDRLDRGTREVLRAASVVGREFTRGVLERAIGGGRLPHALQTLKAAGVIQQVRVVPEPSYRFKHVLMQEVAYASLLEYQRKELHGRVGEAIEAAQPDGLDDQAERLVDHFTHAENWPRAVHYGLRAAERALALSQFAESLEALERAEAAVERLPEGAERRELWLTILLRQERLCETLGDRGRQQRIIDLLVRGLEGSGDRTRLAEVYLRQGDLRTLERRFDEAEEVLEASLALRRDLGDRVGQRNTLRSLGLLRWHQGRNADALHCAEQALAIDRELGEFGALVGDLANLGIVLKGMGDLERARARLEEALTLTREAESRGGAGLDLSTKLMYILHNLANVHRELGEDPKGLEYLDEARELTKARRMPVQLSYHYTSIAHMQLQQGRLEEALALYRQAVELTRKARFVPGLAQALRFLGEVLQGVGREAEALPYLSEAASLFARLRDHATELELGRRVATAAERVASSGDAIAAWSAVRTLALRMGDPAVELEATEGLARLARATGDASGAEVHAGDALRLGERLEDLPAIGRSLNTLATLAWETGRYEEARERYEEGLAVFRRLEAAGETGLMLAGLGVTLSALGRHDEARVRLEEARGECRRAQARSLEARVLGALGDVQRTLGDPAEAVRAYEESLDLRRQVGDRLGEGWMLQRLALALAESGQDQRAGASRSAAAAIAAECRNRELAAACDPLPHHHGAWAPKEA